MSYNAKERLDGKLRFIPTSALMTTISLGEIGCIDATGQVVPASSAQGLKALGRIEEITAEGVTLRRGIFGYDNSSADALSQTDIGSECYISDSHTVAKTATGKSAAGRVYDVSEGKVWVEFV